MADADVAFDCVDNAVGFVMLLLVVVVVVETEAVVMLVVAVLVAQLLLLLLVGGEGGGGEFSKYARLTKSVRIGSPLLHLLYFV